MRKFSKSWLALGLIGLLIIAFGIFGLAGMGDVLGSRGNVNIVAKAGDREVTAVRFKSEFDKARKQAQEEAQRPVTTEEAIAAGFDQGLLQDLGSRLALSEVTDRLGIRVGKAVYEKTLPLTPAFFDPITGKFDPKTYEDLLARNGLTPTEHRELVMEGLAQEHLLRALGIGFEASRTHVAVQAALAKQARDARYLVVDPSKVAKPANPTDAQLEAFLGEMSAQVMKPEMRELTIVRFSSKALAPTVEITPQGVQAVFDFRKDQLAVAETRTVVQVTAKNAAAAAAVAEQLAKGGDPAAVAKSQGATVVTYTDRPKSAIADRKVADVAFSLAEGQTSKPIAGDLGQAVVKVLAVKPGKTVTLDEVRPQMEQEARIRAAEDKISDMADKFEAAISSGSSVSDAAKAVGLTPIVTPLITERGQSEQPTPVAGLSPKLLETAFDLAQGAESELTLDEQGEYFVVHVNRVAPPALPTVDEVRAPLTQAFISREYQQRLKALADQLAERVRKGETIDAVAASIGARTATVTGLSRMSGQDQMAALGQEAANAIVSAKLNEVVVAPGPAGIIIAKVGAVRNGEVAELAQMSNQARGQITNELAKDYQDRVIQAVRDAAKLKVYPENAKRAIGVTPAAAAPDAEGQDKAG